MAAVMAAAIALWVGGEALGVSSVVTAMLGLTALLLTGVLTWSDCLAETNAWDTLAWFPVLIGFSSQLNNLGVIPYFSDQVASTLAALNMGWVSAFFILNAAYFALHYMFASQVSTALGGRGGGEGGCTGSLTGPLSLSLLRRRTPAASIRHSWQ